MKKIAIVVQRCHQEIVGGSEDLAWQYAQLLKTDYDVEVLSTRARDYDTWKNDLPEGEETKDGVLVRRFTVSVGRSEYWHRLNGKLQRDFRRQEYQLQRRWGNPHNLPWPLALQEEWIRQQGPHSRDLCDYLEQNHDQYEQIIFLTYLYPTTYFGSSRVPAEKSLLVPTLHDETPAYLSAFKYMARQFRSMLWNTGAERRLAHTMWGDIAGTIVSMWINTELAERAAVKQPYLLYCGRIDENKGCRELLDYFTRYRKAGAGDLKLILTGKAMMDIPSDPAIEFRGFVSSEEKSSLMAGAHAFVMPSPYESLSVVTLEAMAQEVPVMVSGHCDVLVDHVKANRAGFVYKSYEEFAAALESIAGEAVDLVAMGRRAREYVLQNYAKDVVHARLLNVLQS